MGGLSPLGAPSLLGGGGAGLGHVPDRPWDLQPLSRLNTPQCFLSGPCRVSEVKRSFITRSAAFGPNLRTRNRKSGGDLGQAEPRFLQPQPNVKTSGKQLPPGPRGPGGRVAWEGVA